MNITGLFLYLFLIVHLSANCILLLPEDMARGMYNSYSTLLRENPLIKIVAYALYLSIILHTIYAIMVTIRNRNAKPDKYAVNDFQENSTWHAQNMGWMGALILIFIVIHLMTTVPGLYALGECNFSDHGANRLGANSLLQASIDGYFILPNTINNYLAGKFHEAPVTTEHPAFAKVENEVKEHINRLFSIQGTRTVDDFHRELGKVMWQECAMSRNKAGLEKAIDQIKALREAYWKEVKVTGKANDLNPELEKALRMADFIELALLMCTDALQREESCGAHFREEFQTEDGEAVRVDDQFSYVSAWAFANGDFELHKEQLHFEYIQPSVRSYK